MAYHIQRDIELQGAEILVTEEREFAATAAGIERMLEGAHDEFVPDLGRNDGRNVGADVLSNEFTAGGVFRHANGAGIFCHTVDRIANGLGQRGGHAAKVALPARMREQEGIV